VSVSVVLVLLIAFWRPTSTFKERDDRNVRSLAALLRDPGLRASRLEERLRELGSFPPDASAAHMLADGLITCGIASLGDADRTELARHLYAITAGGDRIATTSSGTIAAMRHTVGQTNCDPGTVDAIANAARRVARQDPNPRRDWW